MAVADKLLSMYDHFVGFYDHFVGLKLVTLPID